MGIITAQQLKEGLDNNQFFLLNILPDGLEREHIPGSKNTDGYAVSFKEDVKKLDPQKPIVVYGISKNSEASAECARRLAAAGFTVHDFSDGVAGWKEAGFPIEGTPKQELTFQDKIYHLDKEKSKVHWIGRNPNGRHYGSIALQSGTVTVEHGKLASANFVLDMNGITNDDVDEKWRQVLIDHLTSADFFETKKYPTATLRVTDFIPRPDSTLGTTNYVCMTQFALKDVKRELAFPIMVTVLPDGIAAQAHFSFDRTLWNVKYGSGRIYEFLGKHLVNDEITIDLYLVAR